MNVALFPNAEVVDFWARYRDDLWLDHDGDGWQMTEHTQLWLTPGHSEEDASLIVEADDGVYALTHLWWRTDRTPEVDPFAPDQAILETQRRRVLAAADIVIRKTFVYGVTAALLLLTRRCSAWQARLLIVRFVTSSSQRSLHARP